LPSEQAKFNPASETKNAPSARSKSLPSTHVVGVITSHQSAYQDFKTFYTHQVCRHWQREFPSLVSYNRFVECISSALVCLFAYLRSCFGTCTGIGFIDSTALPVCHNARIHQHNVFAGIAKPSKTSVRWFFGFNLHSVFSDTGELLA